MSGVANREPLAWVIDVIELETYCIAEVHRLAEPLARQLSIIMGTRAMLIRSNSHTLLSDQEAFWLSKHLDLALPLDAHELHIRHHHPLDDLPYQVHTGRELTLMLAGTKPLSVFTGDPDRDADDAWIFPEDVFAPYVESGQIVRREVLELQMPARAENGLITVRRLLYALPKESWRIEAYLQLWAASHDCGWNEAMEEEEGRLLGYEEWQIDFWRLRHSRS